MYGAYPRFIKSFIRDKKLLFLEEAIAKNSALPARILEIKDRGIIKEGYMADLVVFDAKTIGDTGTYDNPDSFPAGIDQVFVNGRPVVSKGRLTGENPGRVRK